MRKCIYTFPIVLSVLILVSCSTSYKAKPLPFQEPASYPNVQEVSGALVGAKAYVDFREAREAFGFNIREAGMLPVQVVFDNRSLNTLEIDAPQTFLEDSENNLWPILARRFAYERATKYAQTKEIFKEGAYHGFLGAAGGALIGAAVGIVTGENVVEAAGKGAAAGAAAGGFLGGAKGYTSDEANRAVMEDLRQKSLQIRPIEPNSLTYGFIFFPGEAKSAKKLRLKLIETDTGLSHIIFLDF
jgi:hypothetical protein